MLALPNHSASFIICSCLFILYVIHFLVTNSNIHSVHTPKVGFYIVNFFLLFLNKSQKDPTFGYYYLAHSDVTVVHCFKPKFGKTFINSNK